MKKVKETNLRQEGAIVFIDGLIELLIETPGYPDSLLAVGDIVDILQQGKEGYE